MLGATDEALQIWPAAAASTMLVVARSDDHLVVSAEGGATDATVHAEYRWSGRWGSTAADVTLDPGLRRLHLSGGRSGLLLRVELEPAECTTGPGAVLRNNIRQTICAALQDMLGFAEESDAQAAKGLLVSCAQLGLDALARIPASVASEDTGSGTGSAGLAPDFDLSAYKPHGPVVAPSAWPGRATESCVAVARMPRLVLPGDGFGFFRSPRGASSDDGNIGGARELMNRLRQRWWDLADSPHSVFEATGTAWGDWSLTLVRSGAPVEMGNHSGTRTSAFPSSTRWSLHLTERGTSRMSGPIRIVQTINDARGLQALATGEGSRRGTSTVSVAASWVGAQGAENVRDTATDMRSASQLFELASWKHYDRWTLEPLAAGHAPSGSNKRMCIRNAGVPASSMSPCVPVAVFSTADSSGASVANVEDNQRITSGHGTYPAMAVQMRRSINQGDQMGFHRTLTTVLDSPVAFFVPSARDSRRENHRLSSQLSSQQTAASSGQTCVLALVETLGEESFVDPYEVEDLLAYHRSRPVQQQSPDQRLAGLLLFDTVDLEKPADSPFTSQVTFVSWTTVTLPDSSTSRTDSEQVERREPWVRFDLPIHMRYLPPLRYDVDIANRSSSSDGYTEVSIPPPMVVINCGGSHGQGEPEEEMQGDGILSMSGWTPVTVIHRDPAHTTSDQPIGTLGEGDGVVSAEIPTGQLAHAALVWYGTLAATLFAALGVVATARPSG